MKFIYKPEDVKYKRYDTAKPYWVHEGKTDDSVIVEYRGFIQDECKPFVMFKGKLYGAGPINIHDVGATVGCTNRDYYKVDDEFTDIHEANVYDFDVIIAINDIVVNGTADNISVLVPLPGKPAVLDASKIDFDWYINRVNVPEKYRRKGVALAMMKHAVKAMLNNGAAGITVHPGGYDMPETAQNAFYQKCGFVNAGKGGMKYLFK